MYEYIVKEGSLDPLFYFKTSLGYTIEIELLHYPTGLEILGPCYSISVQCLETDNPKKDPKVGKTVCGILYDYLKKNESDILIYVCDSEDNRAAYRQRKFTGWHKLHSNGDYALRKFKVDVGDIIYYSALVFNPVIHEEESLVDHYENELAAIQEHK